MRISTARACVLRRAARYGSLAAVLATAGLVGCASGRARTVAVDIQTPRAPSPVTGWNEVSALRPQVPEDLSPGGIVLWKQAWNALERDDLDSGYRGAIRILDERPESRDAHELAGLIELRAGRLESARQHFARAHRGEGGGDAPRDLHLRVRARELAVGFYLATAGGSDEEAWARLQDLRNAAPNHPLVGSQYEVMRLTLADRVLVAARRESATDPERAIALYRDAIVYVPEAVGLHTELATLYLAHGRAAEAEHEAALGLGLAPDDVGALTVHAQALEAVGKREEALAVYERAARLAPHDRDLARARDELEGALRRAEVPSEYHAIVASKFLTREQLAAALHFRIGNRLARLARRPVIVTDVHESWARDYITESLALGLLTAERNHTFDPDRRVSMGELVTTFRRAAAAIAVAPACVGSRVYPETGIRPQPTRTPSTSLPLQAVGRGEGEGEGEGDGGGGYASGKDALELLSALEDLGCAP